MKELQESLGDLTSHREKNSISIYMPIDPGARTAPIQFGNMLKEAGRLLKGKQAANILEPLTQLRERDDLWRSGMPGMAVFHSSSGTQTHLLPTPPEPLVTVAEHFHLTPVLSLLQEPHRFAVLLLSRNATRIVFGEGHYASSEAVPQVKLPTALSETLPQERREPQLQFHSGSPTTAIFHGQGQNEGRDDEDLKRFLTAIDAGVCNALQDRRMPLVLGGVADLVSKYVAFSRYRHLADQSLEGNMDEANDNEVCSRAYPLALPHLFSQRSREREYAASLLHTDRVVHEPAKVLAAAAQGTVETLFVLRGATLWGNFDPERHLTRIDSEQSAENEELLNLAALHTHRHGGNVFLVNEDRMPRNDSLLTATLRFSVAHQPASQRSQS